MFQFELPKDFLIGTANSSFQSEGAWNRDGKSVNLIDHYARMYQGKELPKGTVGKPRVSSMDLPDDGCFFYDNYEAYIEDMQKTGQNTYRLSISWPRIIPDGTGEVNPKGIEFYNKVFDKMTECGIIPFVDLVHWDIPMAIMEKGGYLSDEFPQWFENYARICFKAFGDRVKFWSTFNETCVTINSGYGTSRFPPYIADRKLCLKAMHNSNLAHFRAVRAYREMGFDGQIGIVHSVLPVYPADPSNPDDVGAMERQVMYRFGMYMDPECEGKYPEKLFEQCPDLLADMPPHFREDLDEWFAPMDFVGLNYYNTSRTKYAPDTPLKSKGVENFYTSPDQKFDQYPAGLMDGLYYVWKRYGIDMYITENGLGQEAANEEEVDCEDNDRITYLREHLRMVARCIRAGIPVKGYYYWNDADSYETVSGYKYKFGLTWVDRKTGRRRWKKSRYYFSKICKTRTVE